MHQNAFVQLGVAALFCDSGQCVAQRVLGAAGHLRNLLLEFQRSTGRIIADAEFAEGRQSAQNSIDFFVVRLAGMNALARK